MEKDRKFRGTGFKHTLPAVMPFFGIWVVMVVLTAPVITVAMMLSGIVPPSTHRAIWFFLLTRVPILALAATGLAIFTTTRVAGPLILLRRAFEDVQRGDMDRRLNFRRTDRHLREVETAFNEMMVALSERGDSRRGLEAQE